MYKNKCTFLKNDKQIKTRGIRETQGNAYSILKRKYEKLDISNVFTSIP